MNLMCAPQALSPISAVTISDIDDFNLAAIKQILVSQRRGTTCLPFKLGLSNDDYEQFERFFTLDPYFQGLFSGSTDIEDVRQELLGIRFDEYQDIQNLLRQHAESDSITCRWITAIVAAGCLGADHLWRDLGLKNRDMLSQLMSFNFQKLWRLNDRDMKWKKFLYKQLCEAEGGYVCRAPSCEECKGFSECFAPEM